MQTKGEIGYVRRVNYGRRVLIAISSTSSKDDLKQVLRLSAGGLGPSVNGKIYEETHAVWQDMEAQAIVIGGRITDALADTVTGGFESLLKNVNQYLKDTKAFDGETGAVPVSFEVRYCSDNEAFANYETVEFAGRIIHEPQAETKQVRNQHIRLTPQDARLINGDSEIDTDDWTLIAVSYQLRASDDGRAAELTVTMDAKELEGDRRFEGDNTHIRTSRTIRAYELNPNDDRTIKEVRASSLSRSHSHYFRDELHLWFTFGDGVVGALRDIRIHVDAPGRNDLAQQGLEAQMDFEVVIE